MEHLRDFSSVEADVPILAKGLFHKSGQVQYSSCKAVRRPNDIQEIVDYQMEAAYFA